MALPTFTELFRRLQDLDETVELEAKTGRELGHSVFETVSAFSNEPGRGGGYLLLGIAPDDPGLFGPSYKVVGVSDPDKLQRDLTTQCAQVFNKPIRPQINVELAPSTRKQVIVVFIPEAPASEKPIHIQSQGLSKGTFRRIGSADVVCTEDDLHALFQLRGTRSYDETIVDGAVWEDLDPQAFHAYRRYRAEVNPAAVELAYDDLELAQALFAIDRHDGVLRPTIAGLILFGNPIALRRYCPMHRIDYLRIDGKEWVRDPAERYQGIEIREALIFAIPRIISHILDDIPKAFYLPKDRVRRKEIPLLPTVAIREAVINALMHRSYRTRQPAQILRYSNRLEIRNPGVSLVPDDRLGEPGSVLRNEKIAAVLHETQFAETKGSGIKVIRDTMSEAGLLPPYFESDRGRDMFVSTFLFQHFLSMEDVDWLTQFKDLHLSDEDAKALVFVRETGIINNAAYRMLNHVDTLVASGRLGALRDASLLEQRGKAAATYYLPGPRLKLPSDAPVSLPVDESPDLESLSPDSESLSPDSKSLSPDLSSLRANLPPDLQEQINMIGSRTEPSMLDETICSLCTWRALSLRELAYLVGRKEDHLRKRSLKRLLSSGRLCYVHPEGINHPNQAYQINEQKN